MASPSTSHEKHDPCTPIRIVSHLSDEQDASYSSCDKIGERHHLVLHFDINETILIGDEAGGDTREDCLHKILAKSAFVQCPSARDNSYQATSAVEPTHWWTGEPIENEDDVTTTGATPPPLYKGWTWPPGCCPYYRTSFKQRSKRFVDHDGRIYRPLYDKMNRLLQPSDRHEEVEHPILSHMIPALFETLVELSQQQEQPFTLVFRTMGSDLDDIAAAVSAFARGEHPNYVGFSNESLVVTPDRLVQGRWVASPCAASSEDRSTIVYEYQLWQDDKLVAAGDEQVLNFVHEQSVCGIKDDYSFWACHGQEPWAGKPVWIVPSSRKDSQGLSYHHILFDDNIHNLEHDSIASVRAPVPKDDRERSSTGRFHSLSGKELLQQHGRYLVRVPTIEPILNPRWFLEQIEQSQQLVRQDSSVSS